MEYNELTVHQKIGLKGYFREDPDFVNYRVVWILWNFKIAIEYFLLDDINILHKQIWLNIEKDNYKMS
ncbi:hypothetical protein JYU20_00705 [Bacteroidales bacterium AH-315-I05]|nr:hypothetical protein [Bacteroidales bacterium AH-315-I05]